MQFRFSFALYHIEIERKKEVTDVEREKYARYVL
jgi:hypothetical protein